MKYTHTFEINVIEAGQRGAYQDSYYHYEVTSTQPEFLVKSYCMNVLKKSYIRVEMPNAFAGELLVFEKITDNKHPDNILDAKTTGDTYRYKVKCLYTG